METVRELKKFDAFKFINDKKTEPIEKIIHKLNWEYIYNGVAGNFHGDFHFENIIMASLADFENACSGLLVY